MSKSRGIYAPRGAPLNVRLDHHTDKTGECWVWTGCKNEWGYGIIRIGKRTRLAHRVAYTVHVGNVPETILVCHTCDNPACVRPSHLVLGTTLDNTRDMVWRGRAVKAFGESHRDSKLTDADVLAIRAAEPRYGYLRRLAAQFNVSVSAVNKVRRKITWKHLL